jgi:hypothetical protein
MFAADQLVAHAVGDYLVQSHWMATAKVRQSFAAAVHAAAYGLPFLFLRPSPLALTVIVTSHFAIDRWRLARFVVWAKNQAAPAAMRPAMTATGYPDDTPPWLAVWLLIVADNVLHVLINGGALAWL